MTSKDRLNLAVVESDDHDGHNNEKWSPNRLGFVVPSFLPRRKSQSTTITTTSSSTIFSLVCQWCSCICL
jgi:hypothetical protein